ELSKVATEASKITVKRGPHAGDTWTAAQVMEKLVKILFDQDYAKSMKVVDRAGKSGATWVDGTPQAQLTPFTLFADGLHSMDLRWGKACDGMSGQAQSDCQT